MCMVEKRDPVLRPRDTQDPWDLPLPQDPMDPRDPQDLWTLAPPGTSEPQEPWEITFTV